MTCDEVFYRQYLSGDDAGLEDERRVQQRLIFERCFDPKIVHVVSSQSFVSGQRRSS